MWRSLEDELSIKALPMTGAEFLVYTSDIQEQEIAPHICVPYN
jgi:hypothetical protein